MHNKKQLYAIMIFLVGVILVGIDIWVHTGIDYGFVFGQNEGVEKGMMTYFLFVILGGKDLSVDICFNPLGYLLMIVAVYPFLKGKSKKFIGNILAFSGIALVCSIVKIVLPFFVNQYELAKPLLICTALEFALFVGILYSFALACKKQVDGYFNMEVGKDLIFGVEIYVVCAAVHFIMQILASMYLFLAEAGSVVTKLLICASIAYYVIKAAKYIRQFGLFYEENQEKS